MKKNRKTGIRKRVVVTNADDKDQRTKYCGFAMWDTVQIVHDLGNERSDIADDKMWGRNMILLIDVKII